MNISYKTFWAKLPVDLQAQFGLESNSSITVSIQLFCLKLKLIILDGNHRYVVFVKELHEKSLWANLVIPIDKDGKLMTFAELCLLQGARNAQHANTSTISMLAVSLFNSSGPLETWLYLAKNCQDFVIINPLPQQKASAMGKDKKVYNYKLLPNKRNELTTSRPDTLRNWFKLGVYVSFLHF